MNEKNERYEIRIAGFGGQGVVTIGRILGTAFSVYEGVNSVNTQSYGPESRGGACRSEVVVSSGVIYYPYVREAHLLTALSQVALDTYGKALRSDGVLIVDPDAVGHLPTAFQGTVYQVPTMQMARKAGNIKFQNSAALGVIYGLVQDKLSETSIRQALADAVPRKTLEGNTSAFEQGKMFLQKNATYSQ